MPEPISDLPPTESTIPPAPGYSPEPAYPTEGGYTPEGYPTGEPTPTGFPTGPGVPTGPTYPTGPTEYPTGPGAEPGGLVTTTRPTTGTTVLGGNGRNGGGLRGGGILGGDGDGGTTTTTTRGVVRGGDILVGGGSGGCPVVLVATITTAGVYLNPSNLLTTMVMAAQEEKGPCTKKRLEAEIEKINKLLAEMAAADPLNYANNASELTQVLQQAGGRDVVAGGGPGGVGPLATSLGRAEGLPAKKPHEMALEALDWEPKLVEVLNSIPPECRPAITDMLTQVKDQYSFDKVLSIPTTWAGDYADQPPRPVDVAAIAALAAKLDTLRKRQEHYDNVTWFNQQLTARSINMWMTKDGLPPQPRKDDYGVEPCDKTDPNFAADLAKWEAAKAAAEAKYKAALWAWDTAPEPSEAEREAWRRTGRMMGGPNVPYPRYNPPQ